MLRCFFFFFFKQKTAYEMRISDWSSDVCSSDLAPFLAALADAPDMRAGAQRDGAAIEAGDLRKTQARLDREEQQHMIAKAEPACSIGRGEDRVALRAREEIDLALPGELAGARGNTRDLPAGWRFLGTENEAERSETQHAGK